MQSAIGSSGTVVAQALPFAQFTPGLYLPCYNGQRHDLSRVCFMCVQLLYFTLMFYVDFRSLLLLAGLMVRPVLEALWFSWFSGCCGFRGFLVLVVLLLWWFSGYSFSLVLVVDVVLVLPWSGSLILRFLWFSCQVLSFSRLSGYCGCVRFLWFFRFSGSLVLVVFWFLWISWCKHFSDLHIILTSTANIICNPIKKIAQL